MAELSPITSVDENSSSDDSELVRNGDEENYKPTPEQNYELEESVNVMTNGRAHVPQVNQRGKGSPVRHQIRFGTRINDGVATISSSPESEQQQQQQQQRGHHHHQQQAQAIPDNDDDYYYYDDYAGNYKGHPGANGERVATNTAQGRHIPNTQGHEQGQNGAGTGDDDDSKVAYVVEGRNYRKYRVEEKTDDGFIVGEYGVVDHNDGNLRGVRYTADSTINPSLIQKALLTFLKLK